MKKHRTSRTATRRPQAPAAGAGLALPKALQRLLDQVAARLTLLRILEGALWITGGLAAMLLARCLLDRWLDFPRPLRIALLVADFAWIGWLLWRFPIRALVRKESWEQSALRVEKHWKQLRSSIISAVQLARAGTRAHGCPDMLRELFAEANRRVQGLNAKQVVPFSVLRKPAIGAAAALSLVGLFGVLAWPSAQILLKRYIGFEEPLPSLTRVFPVSEAVSVPLGGSATLAARAEGYLPSSGRLLVRYENGETREFPVSPDPANPAMFQIEMQNIQSSFTYQFALHDGQGSRYKVTSLTAPVIRALTITAEFPAYTGFKSRELKTNELTILGGTKLSLDLTASQPLQTATWQPTGEGEPVEMRIVQTDPTKASLELTLTNPELTGFSIRLVNQDGTPSSEDAIYPLTVTVDAPPEVKLLQPEVPPETLTPEGGIDIVAEIFDDFGVSELHLVVEAMDEDGSVKIRRTPLKFTPGQQLAFRWIPGSDVPTPGIGDSLTYYLEARDANTVTGPGIGKSTMGSFTLVTPEEKQAEIEMKLQEKAAEINQLREMQRTVTDDLNRVFQTPESAP